MPKLRNRSLILAFALAGVVLPQTSSLTLVTPEIRRVGDKLACKCGVCNNTVATCQMLQCHYSQPAREKIGKMLASGADDQTIVASFVKEGGLSALAAPPTSGFNLLGYVMPFVAMMLGLLAIAYWMRRSRTSRPADLNAEPPIDPRYRERIEKELAEIE